MGSARDDPRASGPPPCSQVDTATASASAPADETEAAAPADETEAAAPADETEAVAEAAAPAGERRPEAAADAEAGGAAQPAYARPEGVGAMSIVFVASECAPYSKSGGLADVMGSLPPALAARGHRVMVVSPRYDAYEGAADTGHRALISKATGIEHDGEVGYFHESRDGVDYLFVDHVSFRRPGGMYGDKYGDYQDNQWRFKMLCLAALEAPLQVELPGGRYGEEVVFVANDWHAGLLPVYVAAHYRRYGTYASARTVFAIHNLRYQGVFSPFTYGELGLPWEWAGATEWQYPPHLRMGAYEEEGRCVNTIKGALATADRIVTVSPTYAEEIQTPLGGFGLHEMLQGRHMMLEGLLNGIDMDEWDPAADAHIPHPFSKDDLAGKAACKAALQRELGLPEDPDVPLVAFIGRLDPQKGADMVLGAAGWLAQEHGVQVVLLGSGDPGMEDELRALEHEHKDRARAWVGFNVAFSHRLNAAADILLMPSRFEPCGLNQMYAQRYGTVPVVHATGGLRDTVEQAVPSAGTGTGWQFTDCTTDGLKACVWEVLQTYWTDKEAWAKIVRNGMEKDFSWNKAAERYEMTMHWAKLDPPYCK